MVDEDGRCAIRDGGPHEDKSPTEKYVELRECNCKSCNHWEEDKATQKGDCGLHEDLFFKILNIKDEYNPKKSQPDGPFCHAYDKQIPKTPPFQAEV